MSYTFLESESLESFLNTFKKGNLSEMFVDLNPGIVDICSSYDYFYVSGNNVVTFSSNNNLLINDRST
jgi:hypothetical protein